LLRIRNQQYLPDGRSVLDTIGGPRFRVLGRQVKDGYYVSEEEFAKDTPVEPSKKEGASHCRNNCHLSLLFSVYLLFYFLLRFC